VAAAGRGPESCYNGLVQPLTIYVETSVWSFAFAEDVPDYHLDTLAFFDACRAGVLSPFVSPAVLAEIDRARPELRERLVDLIHDVGPAVLDVDARAEALAAAFLRERAVTGSKPEDARHVAVAFAGELDALVSWNFRHIASLRRSQRFNAVALMEGFYKPLRIVSPAEVSYDAESDA